MWTPIQAKKQELEETTTHPPLQKEGQAQRSEEKDAKQRRCERGKKRKG